MLSKQTNLKIKNYNGLFKEGHINHRSRGGVAIFIHDNKPFKEITIKTPLPLRAIAARTNIGIDVTIVSIYNSRNK